VPSPPIVHVGPNLVVLGADGCLVLASCDLDLIGKGPQDIFLVILLVEFWRGNGTLPARIKNVMSNEVRQHLSCFS
jgi:hypothetical protein